MAVAVIAVAIWDGRLVKAFIAASLSRAVGGQVTIERFTWRGWGDALLEGLILTAPGWNAPGAQIARVDRVGLRFDPASLAMGPMIVDDVEVTGVSLTLVEDPLRGSIYNFQTLEPSAADSDTSSGASTIVQRANIETFTVAFERLIGVATEPLTAYSGSFSLGPNADHPARSDFAIVENGDGMRLEGWIDQSTLAFSLEAKGLTISKQLALILPRSLRPFAESSDATGRITQARLSRASDGRFNGEMEFENVRATLPNHLLGHWVRYERGRILRGGGHPRFELDRGSIAMRGPTVEFKDLDFRVESTAEDGRVATLPVRASLSADFSAFQRDDRRWRDRSDWVDALTQELPFDLRVSIGGFVLGKSSDNAAIELPEAAAQFLRTFHVEEMEFDLGYSASRAAEPIAASATRREMGIETSGTLVITNGKGAFDGFPYPLDRVAATIRFAGDAIEIADLRGTGPGGDAVMVHGEVTNITGDFGVDLSISASPAPVDATLISCFPSAAREFLSSLIWFDGYEALRSAGLIFGPHEVSGAAHELPILEASLAEMCLSGTATAAEVASLSTRIGHLRHIIDQGSFAPGGKVAFTLNARRAEAADARVVVTGAIRILEGNFLPRIFPYPVRATSGEIVLLEDRADFGTGVPFTTLTGATGVFKGSIDIDQRQNDPAFRPHLEFSLAGEQVNPLLVMAIPPAEDAPVAGWPGTAHSDGGKMLSLIDVRGDLSLHGTIDSTHDDLFDVNCDAVLERGSIRPHLWVDDPLHFGGLLWPTGFGLDDCHARIRVTDERVEVASLAGLRGHGLIEASGFVSLIDSSRDLEVRLRHVDLADYAVNLVPYEDREAARAVWDRYRPTGIFDADLRVSSTSAAPEVTTHLDVRPKALSLSVPNGSVAIAFDSGTLSVHGTTVTCDALSARVTAVPGLESGLCLDGTYGGAGALELSGSIERGVFQSPALHELLRLVAGTNAISTLDQLDPHGRYDATFRYASGAPRTRGSFEVDGWIDELAVGDSSSSLAFRFERPAHIHADERNIVLLPVDATFVGGRLSAAGWLTASPDGSFDEGLAELELLASGVGPELVSALPSPARDTIRALQFRCGDYLHASVSHAIDRNRRGTRISSTDALIILRDAALDAAPGIAHLDGNLELGILGDANDTTFTLSMDDGRLKLAGRTIDHADARIATTNTGDGSVEALLTGTVGGGRVEIDATIGTRDPFAFLSEVSVDGCDLASLTVRGDGVPPPRGAAGKDPGVVAARFGIGGDGRGIASRRGRGSATIHKADLARLPIGLAILQATQMSLSLDPTIDSGEFDFTIDGPNLYFERFNLRCTDLILAGGGWLNTESGELALRLRNRGTTPILSDILGGVANQLFQIDVRGTLSEPKGSLAPLPGIVPPPTLSGSTAAGAIR